MPWAFQRLSARKCFLNESVWCNIVQISGVVVFPRENTIAGRHAFSDRHPFFRAVPQLHEHGGGRQAPLGATQGTGKIALGNVSFWRRLDHGCVVSRRHETTLPRYELVLPTFLIEWRCPLVFRTFPLVSYHGYLRLYDLVIQPCDHQSTVWVHLAYRTTCASDITASLHFLQTLRRLPIDQRPCKIGNSRNRAEVYNSEPYGLLETCCWFVMRSVTLQETYLNLGHNVRNTKMRN